MQGEVVGSPLSSSSRDATWPRSSGRRGDMERTPQRSAEGGANEVENAGRGKRHDSQDSDSSSPRRSGAETERRGNAAKEGDPSEQARYYVQRKSRKLP